MKKVFSKLAGYTLQVRADNTFRVKEGFDWSRIYDFINNKEDSKEIRIKYPGLMEAFSQIGILNAPRVTFGNQSVVDFNGSPVRTIDGMYRIDDLAKALDVPLAEMEETIRKIQSGEIVI